jgi:hypothetical protein
MTEAAGPATHNHIYQFTVDDRPFETRERRQTGASIKAIAGVDPSFGLVLEGHGRHPDKPIADNEVVELHADKVEDFFAVPPATFGAR